jgi:tetratricopeptide (TPR) repeat protein
MTRGQHAQVEARLKQQLSADPRNGSLWFRLGVARAQLKETDPAIEAFQRAVALQTQTELAYFNLGLLYLEKNDGAKAVEAYKRGLALDPSNLPANQNLAFLLVQRGEFRDAIAPLERLKESSPTDVSARIGLAEAYLRAGLNEKGATEIDEILGSHLVTQPQGLALAKQLAAQRHPDLASRVLQSLTVDWPESANAHGELGLLLSEEGQFKNAAKELSRAVQLAPESERYSVGYGEALVNSEQFPTALQFLPDAEKKFPNQPDFQFQLAIAELGAQRFSDAISTLEVITAQTPSSGRAQFLLGGAYELEGKLQIAEEHYRKSIELDPREPSSCRVLGALLQKEGPEHLIESIQVLRKALILDPANVEAKIDLSRGLERQGDLDQAAVLLEQAVASEPTLLRAHSALAEVYARQHKMAEAEHEQSIAATLEGEKITNERNVWDPHSNEPR